jgi:hypothetical protein
VSRQIASELLKLRTTKTAVALIGTVLGLVVLISVLATFTVEENAEEFNTVDLLGISGFSQLIALVLGLLAVTTEIRHGTITPTLVAQPSRVRMVLAKLVANGIAGLVLSGIAVGLCTAIVLAGLSARDNPNRDRGLGRDGDRRRADPRGRPVGGDRSRLRGDRAQPGRRDRGSAHLDVRGREPADAG